MALLQEMWREMPPCTRTYLLLSVATTSAVTLDVVSPLKLYLNWSLVIQKFQLWRLFTTFFFFGNLSLDWLFHMFFLQRYLRMLEINSFRGRTADLVYMLLFGSALLLAISPLTSIFFLGPSLTFMMVYVWARRNSRQVMNFLGVLSFRAPYLPWVLLLFSCIIGSPPSMDLLGVLAGHVYYYMADIYPAMAGARLLRTPGFLVFLCGGEEEEVEEPDLYAPPEPNAEQQAAQPQRPQEPERQPQPAQEGHAHED